MSSGLCCRVLLVAVAAGLIGCGNSSSGGSSDGSSEASPTFTVSTQATDGGTLSPATSVVAENSTVSLTIAPQAGFALDAISGCGGDAAGDAYTTAGINRDCVVSAQFSPVLFSVGGSVSGLTGSLRLSYDVNKSSGAIELASDGAFTVTDQARLGDEYQIVVQQQPAGQTCAVSFGSGTVESDVSDVAIHCEASFAAVAGTVSGLGSMVMDTDINDIFAAFVDNSAPSAAQAVHHLSSVHGFASAQPTEGPPETERFASSSDPDDYFHVVLEAGQTVQLQVLDHNGLETGSRFSGDLDLYLFDAGHALVGASEEAAEFEEVTAPTSQEYLVNVHAHQGVSKYVLHFLPAPASSTSMIRSGAAPEFVPNEMVVRYHDQTSGVTISGASGPSRPDIPGVGNIAPQAMARSARVSIDPAQRVPEQAMQEMKNLNPRAYDRVMTLRTIKAMNQRADVAYAEPNYIRKGFLTPNDPNYKHQWHYTAIGLPEAWDDTTGTGSEQPVIVAVIDTGVVLSHPDLSAQLIAGYDFISDADRARDGDGIDPDADDPGDSDTKGQSSWHGTHVAGTVASASDNGVGVAGVSWGAQIMPIRVLGKDGGTSYDIIQALRYVAGLENDSGTLPLRKADIANMSYGGSHGSSAEREAYAEARAAGVILVAAAGNDDSSATYYPAGYPEVMSVSATDYNNKRAPYSNYGATIAVAAPGGDSDADVDDDGYPDGILSTAASDSMGSIKPNYSFYSGTSMAAPHIAGVLALMKAVYADLTPDAADSLLHNGGMTDDLGAVGRDDIYGYGLVNAVKGVQAALELATGAELLEVPADVVATPSPLDLGFRSTATVSLDNQGGGDPAVTSVSRNAAWLAVAPSAVDAQGLGSYSVVADRSGLAGGSYAGEITFDIDDGSAVVVPVTVQVDAASDAGELGRMFVLLLDNVSQQMVDQVVIETTSRSANYVFERVAPGEYLIVAGSDVDADRRICTLGETCGGYHTLSDLKSVTVGHTDVEGVDFSTSVLNNASSPVIDQDYVREE